MKKTKNVELKITEEVEELMGFFLCQRCKAKTLYLLMPKNKPEYPQCQYCGLTQLMKDKEVVE